MCFAARLLMGRNEIDSAGMKGMTTGKATDGQPDPAHQTVLTNGFDGVHGTTGIKTAATTEPIAQRPLIQPDQPDPHPNACFFETHCGAYTPAF